MAQNIADTPADGPNDGNFPGFRYLERVTAAANRAVIAHTKELNGAWTDMREGRYSAAAAIQSWTRLAENYFGVVTEAFRAPNAVQAPAWMGIRYSKSAPLKDYAVRVDDVLEIGSLFEVTRFASMGAAGPVDGVLAGTPVVAGSRIEIELDEQKVNALDNGTYFGLIFRAGAGSAPPLVVVVLRVTD
jgi:hypothetical protein